MYNILLKQGSVGDVGIQGRSGEAGPQVYSAKAVLWCTDCLSVYCYFSCNHMLWHLKKKHTIKYYMHTVCHSSFSLFMILY